MVKVALVVKLQAKAGKEEALGSFLAGALPLAEDERGTPVWFALRLGASTFGIFDAFPDDAARQTHLSGPIAKALMAKAPELLDAPPSIEPVEVLAVKLARAYPDRSVARLGLLARLEAKAGKEEDVARFLAGALPAAEGEPGTSVWFAFRVGPSTFGIFDTFPDEAARKAHLSGPIATALLAKASELLAAAPVIEPVALTAGKLPG
ncbi:putative quinol monooxygenase [Chondromyces apiculatus]|uniref:Antibiotic biosynthesis monooxygenase n=1 Tax=Chondromyces apiculatus DSM 436 TaxID=1192034 RepID=A0A017T1T9_9BACT|nr:hypothetical protein [Chondromyces apiculatus]EYF02815.1 Hypothetical protein CAP_6550 [Chondromyces apiculatus DSM 436]